METRDLLILVAVASFLAFRLYQKYSKKNLNNTANNKKTSSDTTYFSASKDDDYEPYSKKQN